MLNQILTSALWQTLGVFILIIATAVSILVAIHKLPGLVNRPKTKMFYDSITIFFTLLLILGTSYASYTLSTPQKPVVNPTVMPTTSIMASYTTGASTPSPTVSLVPTSVPTPTDYSAAQPGSGCDTTGGGTWTEQGLNQIQCGTTISSNTNSRGYLYLQLPNNANFSPKNKISVMGGNLDYVTGPVCLGLAEQETNIGVLGEFCGNGDWYIYSISSTGVPTQTLNKGLTSTRTTEEISLTLQGNAVSFSIDTEIYKATISSIKPVKVAITSYNETPNNFNSITVTNFSYIPQTN